MQRRVRTRSGGDGTDRGAGLVEYVLLLALIAMVCVSALTFFGQSSGNSVNHSKDCIISAGTSPC